MAKKGGSETSDPPAGPSPSLNHPGSGTLTTDASTAGRTTFFSLPAELRVQIYRHAFVPDHIIELTPKETRWEDYPPLARIRPHAINPIVSALLVSKRFAREASAEFYRHAIFHLGVHWHVNHHEFARRVNRNCLRSGGNANTLVHLARLKDLERIERLILTVYSEMTRVQAPNSYDFQMVADGKPVPLPAPPACHTYGATEEEQRTELRREEYEDPVERTLGRRTDFEPLLLPVSLHDFEPHEQSKREWDRLCQLLFRGGPLTTRDATWYGKKNHLNLGGGLCGVLELKVMVRITAFAKHVNVRRAMGNIYPVLAHFLRTLQSTLPAGATFSAHVPPVSDMARNRHASTTNQHVALILCHRLKSLHQRHAHALLAKVLEGKGCVEGA